MDAPAQEEKRKRKNDLQQELRRRKKEKAELLQMPMELSDWEDFLPDNEGDVEQETILRRQKWVEAKRRSREAAAARNEAEEVKAQEANRVEPQCGATTASCEEDDGFVYYSGEEEDVYRTSVSMSDYGRESDDEAPSGLDTEEMEEYISREELLQYMDDLERRQQEEEDKVADGDSPQGPTVADMRRDAARMARPHLMQKRLEVIEPCLEHAPSTSTGVKECIICGDFGEEEPAGKVEVWCGSCEHYLCTSCDLRLHREGDFVLHNRIALCDDGCNVAMDHRKFVKDGVVTDMPAAVAGEDSVFLRPLPYDAPCSRCYHGVWDQIPIGGGKTTGFVDDEGGQPVSEFAPCVLVLLRWPRLWRGRLVAHACELRKFEGEQFVVSEIATYTCRSCCALFHTSQPCLFW